MHKPPESKHNIKLVEPNHVKLSNVKSKCYLDGYTLSDWAEFFNAHELEVKHMFGAVQ